MKTQKKLSFLFIVIIFVAFATLIAIVTVGFYNLGSRHASEKANLTAELVKDGLTAHMVNGIMDNREFFLKRIENAKNIDGLWVTRSPSVIAQFGKGFNNEVPRDAIDRDVIEHGKTYRQLFESAENVKLRFTVPYTATAFGSPNCMNCHDSKEGEILGTVSMIFDVTETRNSSLITIFYIILVSVFVMLVVLFALNRSLNPVWSLFNSINSVMSSASKGDYSRRVAVAEKHGESKQVAKWINNFLDKLENTLDKIQANVRDFFISYEHHQDDSLLDTEQVILQMADIYRFKKTIEFDESKNMIYERLGNVLKNYFKLSNFKFFEANNQNNEVICVYDNNQDVTVEFDRSCRALRTKQHVYSDQFDNICPVCDEVSEFYVCAPYTISDEFDLLIHFTAENMEELNFIKGIFPKIENYVDSARSELVSKNLTEILRKSSTTDQLTGLYNRKFLDDFIDKTTPQILRSHNSYGILMLDIDFFKAVNDNYGHDVGDKVIKVLSDVLKSCIRESDLAFRYGGEEFLIMLFNCDTNKIDAISNKIRITFSEQNIDTGSGASLRKTLSIGYSSFPQDADSIWRCIKFADIALYEAKETGRNRVIGFQKEMLGEGELKDTYSS